VSEVDDDGGDLLWDTVVIVVVAVVALPAPRLDGRCRQLRR